MVGGNQRLRRVCALAPAGLLETLVINKPRVTASVGLTRHMCIVYRWAIVLASDQPLATPSHY